MKIPHTIPKLILRAYTKKKTPEELAKQYEGRVLRSEDVNWDDGLFQVGYVKPLEQQGLNLIIEKYPFYVKLTEEWNRIGLTSHEKAREQWAIDLATYHRRKASYDRRILEYDLLVAKIGRADLENLFTHDSDSSDSDDDAQQIRNLKNIVEPAHVPEEFPEYQPMPAVLDRLTPDDRCKVIEELDLEKVPLEVAIHTIPDEYYWERMCNEKWPEEDPDEYGNSWRRMYMEKHVRETIENFHPYESEWPPLQDQIDLCGRFVNTLTLNSLIPECWGVPRKAFIQPLFEGDAPPVLGSGVRLTPEDEGFDESKFMADFWVKSRERKEKIEDAKVKILMNGGDIEGMTDAELLARAEEEEMESGAKKARTNSHIDLSLIIPKLSNLTKLSIIYEMAEMGGEWEPRFIEFTMRDCEVLAKTLAESPTIETFELNRSRVNGELAKILVRDGLLKMPHLKVLNLNYNRFGPSGALAIARLITDETSRVRHTLHTLKLARNNIKSKGCKAIAYALTLNRYLTFIDLRLNNIGNSGGKDIGHALVVNKSVQSLNLAANLLTDPTCVVLGKMLHHNETLKELDLSSNNLGTKGGEAIALAMRTNKIILKLDVRLANMGLEIEYDIEAHLIKNRARLPYNLLEQDDIYPPEKEGGLTESEEEDEKDESEEELEEAEIMWQNKVASDDSEQEFGDDEKKQQQQVTGMAEIEGGDDEEEEDYEGEDETGQHEE